MKEENTWEHAHSIYTAGNKAVRLLLWDLCCAWDTIDPSLQSVHWSVFKFPRSSSQTCGCGSSPDIIVEAGLSGFAQPMASMVLTSDVWRFNLGKVRMIFVSHVRSQLAPRGVQP